MTLQTQLESWYKTQEGIGARHKQVLNALNIHPMTSKQLSKFLRLPINSISGRITELREEGKVRVGDVVYDNETKRSVQVWVLR
jgi:predicted transcriptional regulator